MDCICSTLITSNSLTVLKKINDFNFCTNTQCFEIENSSADWEFSAIQMVPLILLFSPYILNLLKK